MVYFMVFIEWSKRRKMMESKYNRKNELPENCLKPNQVRGAVKDSHEDLMEHGSTFNSNLVKWFTMNSQTPRNAEKTSSFWGCIPHHRWSTVTSPWPWHIRFQLPRLPICSFRQLSFLKNLRTAWLCWPQFSITPKQGEGGEDVRTLIRTLITRGNSNMSCCELHVVLVHYSGIYIREFWSVRHPWDSYFQNGLRQPSS